MTNYTLAIIGGGAAGLMAAIEAKRNGINDIILFEKDEQLGGILNQCIHNGFGLQLFKEELTGPSYAQRLIDEVFQLGITIKLSTMVTKITENKLICYANENEGFCDIKAQAILFTSGAYEKNAGSIQFPGKRLKGIMSAGLAQYYLNIEGYPIGKKALIVGSGDVGLIMARRLTLEGVEVVGVVEIMPYSSGLLRNLQQCLYDFNIPLYLSHRVIDVKGNKNVESLTIAKVDDKMNVIANSELNFNVDCILLSVGLLPDASFLKDLPIKTHLKTKGALVDDYYMSNLDGFFFAGNALHIHDLVDEACLEASRAISGITNYLSKKHKSRLSNISYSNMISYGLPTKYHKDNPDDILITYRVKKPLKKAKLTIKNNSQIIYTQNLFDLMPSLMQSFKLKKEYYTNYSELNIEVEEVL